jgi:hypothetical protein
VTVAAFRCNFALAAVLRLATEGICQGMDFTNANDPPASALDRKNYPLVELVLLASGGVWLIVGLATWRAFSGWLHGPLTEAALQPSLSLGGNLAILLGLP